MGKTEYVYVMFDPATNLHKIGWSINPTERRKRLGSSLELIEAIPTPQGYRAEQAIHRHLADRRIYREWFALTQDDIEWVKRWELYYPVFGDFVSSAVTCQCHPPRFTMCSHWREWDHTFTRIA